MTTATVYWYHTIQNHPAHHTSHTLPSVPFPGILKIVVFLSATTPPPT